MISTYADIIYLGNNFQFSSQPAAAPSKGYGQSTGKIASTQSRYKPKPVSDPFAFSEDDFYSSRPTKSEYTVFYVMYGAHQICR